MVPKTTRLLLAVPLLTGAFFAINAFSKTNHAIRYTGNHEDRFAHCEVLSGKGQFAISPGQFASFEVHVVKDRYGKVTGYLAYEQDEQKQTVSLDCFRSKGGEVIVSGRTPAGRILSFHFADGGEGTDRISVPVEGAACTAAAPPYITLSSGGLSLEHQ